MIATIKFSKEGDTLQNTKYHHLVDISCHANISFYLLKD